MNESIGGALSLFLVLFFIVVISLYMAFNVNYQKAFNVKNRIIELYNENNGKCITDEKCKKEIENYEKSVGYGNVSNTKAQELCPKGTEVVSGLSYCHGAVEVKGDDTEGVVEEARKTCYYEVVTFVEIDIPVINNLLKLRMFQVTGQTKQMKIEPEKECGAYLG